MQTAFAPAGHAPARSTASPGFDSAMLGRIAAIGAAAAAVAVAIGTAVGFCVFAVVMSGASPDDQWAELGAFIFGLFGGLVAGGTAYIAGVVVGVRRLMPEGSRLWPALALVVLPPAVLVSNLAMTSLAGI